MDMDIMDIINIINILLKYSKNTNLNDQYIEYKISKINSHKINTMNINFKLFEFNLFPIK